MAGGEKYAMGAPTAGSTAVYDYQGAPEDDHHTPRWEQY